MTHDALACVELASLARGLRVLDVIVKRAPVRLRHHGRHSSGKYVILVDGDVASVEESYEEALQHAGDCLLDHMFLPQVHTRLQAALAGETTEPAGDALLLAETTTVACLIDALDFTVKLIDAEIVDLQLASGIHGKGYFAVEASLHDVEYARDELLIRLPEASCVGIEIIARPHVDVLTAVGHGDPFSS